MLVQEIDSEMSGAHTVFKHRLSIVYLTQHWMLTKNNFGGTPMRLDRVVWAYRHVMKRKLYFAITVAKRHSIVAFDNVGQRFQVQLNEQKVTDLLRELAGRASQAIYGYDQRVLNIWKNCGKDKTGFLAQARTIVTPEEVLRERSSSLPVSM